MKIHLPPAYRPATNPKVVHLALELFRLMPGRPWLPAIPSHSWQYRFCKEVASIVIEEQDRAQPKRKAA